jgi:hypothetical protein
MEYFVMGWSDARWDNDVIKSVRGIIFIGDNSDAVRGCSGSVIEDIRDNAQACYRVNK